MGGIFGSSGRHGDPLGVIAALVGVAGAACSALMWIYQINPDSTFLGSYSAQMTNGGRLGSQLVLLAAVFGLMAIIAGILSSLGGRAGASVVIALVLGVVALSYPVLSWLNVVSGPLRPSLFQ
jgi:hypothetical protein